MQRFKITTTGTGMLKVSSGIASLTFSLPTADVREYLRHNESPSNLFFGRRQYYLYANFLLVDSMSANEKLARETEENLRLQAMQIKAYAAISRLQKQMRKTAEMAAGEEFDPDDLPF